jgi:hypothetical protein
VICTFQGVAGLATHDTLLRGGGVAGNGGTIEVRLHQPPGRRLTRPKQKGPEGPIRLTPHPAISLPAKALRSAALTESLR